MAQYPNPVENREELNLRLGIKSSLYNLRSIVASLYSMYIATNKTSHINYTQEFTTSGITSLKMQDSIRIGIDDFFGESQDISGKIEMTPLFKAQIEALQVGLELFFHLAKVSFCQSGLSERTGSNRYNKCLDFSTNLLQLDLLLSSYPESEVKEFLVSWIGEKTYESELENKVLMMLSVFSEDTQCKIRTTKGTEVYFQREGIYQLLTKGETVVSEDAKELVGPYRILKSYISSGMHPFIQDKNKVFQSSSDSTALANYAAMVSTMLDLSPRRQMIIQEETETPQDVNHLNKDNQPHQQIYYGAPGTGKSHEIKKTTDTMPIENVFRTTFHPDSDYASFVGCYKPTKEDDKITYSFIPQVFTNAYVKAWEEMKQENPQPVYLVIEEINRGNCAQIFGDLFQLLDRKENGYSEYPIDIDEDLKNYLVQELGTDSEGIKDGKLCLPPNLNLLATMNTSDQSLFPMDSAFKRRWDWEYVAIRYTAAEAKDDKDDFHTFTITIDDKHHYLWTDFLKNVNEKILSVTDSEDKQMGEYFIKKSVDQKTFINKVMYYLWSEVGKDMYNTTNALFTLPEDYKDKDGKAQNQFSFNELFKGDATKLLIGFMKKLEVKSEEEKDGSGNNDKEEASEE